MDLDLRGMDMRIVLAISLGVALATTSPVWAQPHESHAQHDAQLAEHQHGATAADALAGYRSALTQRDAEAMMALFAENSLVVENGKVEGTFAEYMEHHLGPELDAITRFEFSDVETDIEMLGHHVALGRETYSYRIELADGRVFERTGAATSVLTHDADGWKILRYHSSSRPVRNP
jgi:ketosteroid isomerase-like protein